MFSQASVEITLKVSGKSPTMFFENGTKKNLTYQIGMHVVKPKALCFLCSDTVIRAMFLGSNPISYIRK